jgi:hypothetical protein
MSMSDRTKGDAMADIHVALMLALVEPVSRALGTAMRGLAEAEGIDPDALSARLVSLPLGETDPELRRYTAFILARAAVAMRVPEFPRQ